MTTEPTIAARVLVPEGTPRGVFIYYHGGGWVRGSLTTHVAGCRLLAHLSGVRILSVDYRLAPEHPVPVPVEDSYAGLRWLSQHASDLGLDPDRIAVGGASAAHETGGGRLREERPGTDHRQAREHCGNDR